MDMSFKKIAIATTTLTCATLFSFGWSEQRGVSLSIESAQARIGRPLTPVSVAGVARRNYRRAAYGYGAGVVGAGVATAAIGAAAVAATTPGGYYRSGYYRSGAYAPAAYYGQPSGYADSYAYANTGSGWAGGYYASSPWGFHECQPHHIYDCSPYSEAWSH
ncbi:hypothetical protein SAMN05444170_4378 [Bradyrhizobium erythrophlei]|jgi:hypothetical protein|uniref:Uncharacterized protein n=1 Tax=Bradyrhizobium erythrophlei TaxID=1437360 RepID=A0A1M7UC10_9BRAD|nr:hypothetical protein SAMN05444170_4378 [Bradyrhizobium erythrophlei]